MRAEVVLLVSLTAFIPASLTVAADAGPAARTRFASSRPGEIVVSVTVGGLGPFRFLLDTGSTHTAVTEQAGGRGRRRARGADGDAGGRRQRRVSRRRAADRGRRRRVG